MKGIKKVLIGLMIGSSLTMNDTINIAATTINHPKEKKRAEKLLETIQEESMNIQSYNTKVSAVSTTKISTKELKKKVLKKARKVSRTVNSKMVDLAFEYAGYKAPKEENKREYYRMVAIHLTVMELESNFDNSIICDNGSTKDYGIMQVNTMVIPDCKKSLKDYSLDVYNLRDNVKMGSWEIDLCYKKAKKLHPESTLWWTYAYYNRGMYFKLNSYNYKETNTRSQKFISTYKKYFKLFKGEY